MNNEHVIKNLNAMKMNYDQRDKKSIPIQTINLAIEALEKQTPTETNKDIYDIEEPSDRCPNCMGFVFGKYCHNCGQKIFWEELK